MNHIDAMLNSYRPQDDKRRVSTGADSISSSSVVTIKPAESDKISTARRFVSAPIRPTNKADEAFAPASWSPEHIREGGIPQQPFGQDEYRDRRMSASSGSITGSPRLHRTGTSASKRFSLKNSFGFGARTESPSQHSSPSQQDGSPPSRAASTIGKISSRRVATMSAAEPLASPKRPPLVSNVSSPSILGLSSRTIDSYRRESPENIAARQPAPRLLLNTRQDNPPRMGMSRFHSVQTRAPALPSSNPTMPENKESDQVKRTKSTGSRPEKKSMLSRALARANDAVALDNAQDYAGAMAAYEEACECLREVMKHSSNNDDRSKLESIRGTYISRIRELRQADDIWNSNQHVQQDHATRPLVVRRARSPAQPAAQSRNTDKGLPSLPRTSRILAEEFVPPSNGDRPVSVDATWSDEDYDISIVPPQTAEDFSFNSDLTEQDPDAEVANSVERGIQQNTQRTSRTQDSLESIPAHQNAWIPTDEHEPPNSIADHQAQDEPIWSQASLPDSLAEDLDLARTLTNESNTEAAFHAALDAAIEAAYDDGYQPIDDLDLLIEENAPPRPLTAQRIREQGSAIAAAGSDGQDAMSAAHFEDAPDAYQTLGLQNDVEAHERLLNEITRDFMLDNNALDERIKSMFPRQSDSSTSSSAHTWDSSAASSVHTAGTSLSPVREKPAFTSSLSRGIPPASLSSNTILGTSTSLSAPSQPMSRSSNEGLTVQDRRLSRSKHLQIKTASNATPSAGVSGRDEDSTQERQETSPVSRIGAKGEADITSPSLRAPTSISTSLRSGNIDTVSPATSPTATSTRSGFARPYLDRNGSNISSQARQVATIPRKPVEIPASPGHSAGLLSSARLFPQAARTLPSSVLSSALQLDFLVDIHNLTALQQKQDSLDFPKALEPYPDPALLRPFWLLRCVYQTIAHPKGGYLSTKLFVPRNIWKVQNVKLKNIDDKIAACDSLTAALVHLRKTGLSDTHVLLQELHHFQTVMDQVQSILSRRLGSDVGSKDLASSFRDAPPSASASFGHSSSLGDSSTNPLSTSTASNGGSMRVTSGSGSGGKSYLSSLGRKLRNKPSHSSIATSFASTSASFASTNNAAAAAPYTLATVPMTSAPSAVLPASTARPNGYALAPFLTPPLAPSAGGKPLPDGPYVLYANALARLCDAAQVLVQIAQLSSEGINAGAISAEQQSALDTFTRRASEFFALYVVRWVLADVGALVDKWIKRAGESLIV